MSKKLLDSSSSSSEDENEESGFKINDDYAKVFNKYSLFHDVVYRVMTTFSICQTKITVVRLQFLQFAPTFN